MEGPDIETAAAEPPEKGQKDCSKTFAHQALLRKYVVSEKPLQKDKRGQSSRLQSPRHSPMMGSLLCYVREGAPELPYIRSTRKEQTLSFARLVKLTMNLLRFYYDLNRKIKLPRTSWDLLGPLRRS